MSDGQDLYETLSLPIDNCEWKTLQDESLCSVRSAGPASRWRDYQVYGSAQLADKIERRGFVPFLVSDYGGFKFL